MKEIQFGFGQIFSAPPKWAIALIIILLVLSSVLQFTVAGDPAIKAEIQVRILLYLKSFEMLLLAIGSLMGVKPKKEEGV